VRYFFDIKRIGFLPQKQQQQIFLFKKTIFILNCTWSSFSKIKKIINIKNKQKNERHDFTSLNIKIHGK